MTDEKEPTQPPKDRRFRKKPVVVSAFPGDDLLTGAIEFFPEWILAARREGKLHIDPMFGYVIDTLEGEMVVTKGDWIIRGVQGELYPCKPGIFAATYEECTDGE